MARNPQEKIDRILTAAMAEFARVGPEGARIDSIAEEAGMNKRLLYHYVGGKEALFHAAVARCLAVMARAEGELDAVPREVWRILCHAEATGRAPPIAELAAAMGRAGKPGGDAGHLAATAMFRSLLPSLAEALIDHGVPARVGTDQKPRVKLKPDLRGVSGRG
jgi:AcrR family transcriptional regulator